MKSTSISADQEREFYDTEFRRFLAYPDDALRIDREILYASLNDPAQPIYERRRLYSRVFDLLLASGLPGRRILDYGCGAAPWGVWMATEGAEATLLDLSPVAIELGVRRAAASGVGNRVRGEARDAADLGCFPDGAFDLIYAGAALHHTLKYPGAFEELVRVLAPGGMLLLAETYGNNPFMNLARRCRARLENEPAEQGEEILISRREIDLLRAALSRVETHPLNLLAMGKRLLRGRFANPAVRAIVGGLEGADGLLLTLAPPLAKYCGEVVIQGYKDKLPS